MSTITNARDRPERSEIQKIKQKIKAAINSNKRLLSFLKENKVYGRYIKNTVNALIKEDAGKINYISASSPIEKIEQDYYPINCAFTWSKTSEGYDFWRKCDLAYRATIKNKEKY